LLPNSFYKKKALICSHLGIWSIKIITILIPVLFAVIYLTVVLPNYENDAQFFGSPNKVTSLFITLLHGDYNTGWVEITISKNSNFEAGGTGSYVVNVNADNVGFQFPLPSTDVYGYDKVCWQVKVTQKSACEPIGSTDTNGAASVSLDLNSGS
jgi:hypothetical protein